MVGECYSADAHAHRYAVSIKSLPCTCDASHRRITPRCAELVRFSRALRLRYRCPLSIQYDVAGARHVAADFGLLGLLVVWWLAV
jgi:hypothetical protein